ncbi:MAG TPA: carbonic anhydrase, partial [Myxococcota bacterium]
MKKLLDGIHKFQSSYFGEHKTLFQKLAKGQTPETLFITCSDSRISPNLITQTDPGDLFILRNAGNLVPPYGAMPSGEAATIEYAIDVLGVKDIIVCGHTHCGAMKAVLDPTGLDELPAVKSWLTHAECTRRVMKKHYATIPEDHKLTTCVEENVLAQIENLRTHPAVYAAMLDGRVRVHAWVYQIEPGKVFAFDVA